MMKAVILDVDGTLIDSNDAHAQAWEIALKEAGHTVPSDKIRALIGAGGDHILPRLANVSADSPDGKRIAERRGEIFRAEFLPDLVPFPGARDLLEEFRARGMKLAVASSASAEDLDKILKQARVDDLIDIRVSGDDAERTKPDPDIVVAALAELGVPANDALMLGDTPYDIEAAQRAGIDTVALTCGGWDVAALRGAVEIYSDPQDLLYHYEKSVFGGHSIPLESRREKFGRFLGINTHQ